MQIEVDSDFGAGSGLGAGVHTLVVRVTIVISDMTFTQK